MFILYFSVDIFLFFLICTFLKCNCQIRTCSKFFQWYDLKWIKMIILYENNNFEKIVQN